MTVTLEAATRDITRAGGIVIERYRRRTAAVAMAIALDLAVSARTNVAMASDEEPAVSDVAFEMMPDDALSPADERALGQLRDALEVIGPGEPGRTAGRRAIEEVADHHASLLLRWLLGAERRVALGYKRGALLDVLVTSRDARAYGLATEALLARPGLGYCMHALPPAEKAGRLAAVVRDLGIVETLRGEAARLLLTVGDPAAAARTHDEARAHAERIALDQPRVVRRWLLDETDAGMFDTYRAEIVSALLASAAAPLRALATEIVARRVRLTPAGDTAAAASIATKPALTAAR